jgi:serine/threonine-protein kinase
MAQQETLDAASENELRVGHVLDLRFQMEDVIGRSGMATIYRAVDMQTGSTVAVKVPKMNIESDPVSYGRFVREERIGSRLRDPSLLRFIPMAGPKSRPYIVTEFLDGCTLAWVMHRVRPLAEADALKIAGAVCEALRALHNRGFVHRDLKPGNIMICRDGRLCLMDFGLAEETGESRGLLAGLAPLFGTPEYMAPEQVANRRNDERTDVYCLGVILYQMLTGSLPFVAEDVWSAAHMRINGDPLPLRSVNPNVTPQAEEIVLHAMRRNPKDRYQTAAELKRDLEQPERVHVTGLSQRLQAPRWRLSLQGTPILSGVVIGILALASMVGLFFLLLHSR